MRNIPHRIIQHINKMSTTYCRFCFVKKILIFFK
ncbi:MAG: zinc-finger domain-containing protein [Clostridia bacterium]|nr:zinc-finger domain-containing protein [Clostridia bacterium]